MDGRNKERLLFIALMIYTAAVYGPMAVMSIGAVLAFFAWLVLRYGKLVDDLKRVTKSPLYWPSIVLAVACAWSLVWASVTDLTYLGQRPRIEWIPDLRKLWHLFFPFILLGIFSTLSDKRLRKVALFWILLGSASAVLGVIQHYVPLYKPLRLPDIGLQSYFHSTGMTGFHLSYASIIAFPTGVMMAVVAVLYRREKFSRRTLLAALGALVFFTANIFTYSKMTWLAVPTTVILVALIGFKGWPRYLVLALIVVFSVFWATSPQVRMRMQGTDTIKERFEVWGANIDMIVSYPAFGVGWHHNSDLSEAYYANNGVKRGFVSHAHNNLIDQWATTGLFGLLAFLWWNFALFWMNFRLYRLNHALLWRVMGLGFVAGLFCMHLNGLTQSNFWDAKVLHQIGWVAALSMEMFRRYVQSGKHT